MIKKTITFAYKNIVAAKSIRQFNRLKRRRISDFYLNNEYQIKKLYAVVLEAFSTVSYYENLKSDFDVKAFSYENFQKIPVLTKDLIRNEGDTMLNRAYTKIDKVFKNTSGGSTGEPVEFFQTKDQFYHGMANYYYALHLNNVNHYDRSVDFWGAERDMHVSGEKFNIRTLIHNKYRLNTFVMNDKIMENYISRLNRIKPKFIKAYVHSVYDLSKYINKHQINVDFKPIIHCTTGPLYPEMRKEIKKAFNQAHVYNFYGSREVSAIASEVIGNEGLHVFFDNVFVEIVDENNRPVEKGMEGEVLITTLNNHYMPLIRYKIGDRAIKGDDLEFGTLKLDAVVGRTLGIIHKSDGSKIDGQFFTTLFFDTKGIKNFQLVQKTWHYLILNIVKTSDFDPDELGQIVKRIQKELPGVEIELNFCETINLTSTGKIMYVYSELA